MYVNGKAIESTLVAADTFYEDRYHDVAGDKVSKRSASCYRETYNGHTYEIFDDIERPSTNAPKPGTKDFPTEDRIPSCTSQMDRRVAGSEALGKLVRTRAASADCGLHQHFVVPPDTVFAMGDNRGNSNDSRFWGVVPMANVRGTVD